MDEVEKKLASHQLAFEEERKDVQVVFSAEELGIEGDLWSGPRKAWPHTGDASNNELIEYLEQRAEDLPAGAHDAFLRTGDTTGDTGIFDE